MMDADITSNLPLQVATALVGAPVLAIERLLGAGRNSRVYRVRTASEQYALKQYPVREEDSRDRLAIEVTALQFMEGFQLKCVPRVVGVDRPRNFVLLNWIEGEPVVEISETDVEQACDFLAAVHALRQVSAIPEHFLAAEACLSGAEVERQIATRLAHLQKLTADEKELFSFLLHQFVPARSHFIARARAEMAASALDFDQPLDHEWRSLVPADFGFHNSLRRPDGSLAFFDFEYFGWDDPVKMTADCCSIRA
jgi:Ser/Thr protein kinase RdoA (MazF antagonist)